jgi:pimeloyl-[acyl-carrier protein] methyl ester esterase
MIRFVDEALPVTEDYFIVAESFSGPIAITIATRNPPPKRLRGVVLSATFAEAPLEGLWAVLANVFGGIFMRFNPPGFVIRRFLLDVDAPAEDVECVAEAIGSVSGAVMAKRLRILLKMDVRRRLGLTKVPVLILAAKKDRLVARGVTQRLIDGVTGAEVVWIEGPHLLLMSRTLEVWDAVRDFVERRR